MTHDHHSHDDGCTVGTGASVRSPNEMKGYDGCHIPKVLGAAACASESITCGGLSHFLSRTETLNSEGKTDSYSDSINVEKFTI